MLKERKRVRQHEGDGFRRLFQDDFFDLFVWYEAANRLDEIQGFQLCYAKHQDEHALTWKRTDGFAHSRVDTGDATPEKDMTPILVAGGSFPHEAITPLFEEHSRGMDRSIAAFVLLKLREYADEAQP